MSFQLLRRGVLIGVLFSAIGTSLPTSAADSVKVAIISRTFFYLPLWIATREGFMKEEGLDLTIAIKDNSDEVNEMLAKGDVQITVRTTEAAMIDAYRGGHLRV